MHPTAPADVAGADLRKQANLPADLHLCDSRIDDMRIGDRRFFELGGRRKIDRIEIEEIGLEIRIDESQFDRVRPGDQALRKRPEIDLRIFPFIDMLRDCWALALR